nr:MAG TPA_asm: hypothetical protein [Caudoviricetes sp.]
MGKIREKVGSFWKILSDIMVLSEEKGRKTVRGRKHYV